jgi:hypothetical protein
MNKLKISESELFKNIEKWIGHNVDVIEKAQNISKKINDANLLHIYRSLPFEILPIDDVASEFKLVVYLDHPCLDSLEIIVTKDDYFSLYKDDHKTILTENEIDELIIKYNNEDNAIYVKFVESIFNRNYTELNKIVNSELAKYRSKIDPKLKEIKDYLKSIENIGLTSPADGSVSYLNRVVGRWDLALTWENCPFVVISNSELTDVIKEKVSDFKSFEKTCSALLNTIQKACLTSNMDVQVITDSKENEVDASGWLSLDKFGVPQIGPLLHVVKINVYSVLEGNFKKEMTSSSGLILK